MPPDRPPCATCGGKIPRELLTDRDVAAEIEYATRMGQPSRPFFCSLGCFQVYRDGLHGTGRRSTERLAALRRAREARANVSTQPNLLTETPELAASGPRHEDGTA